MHASSLLHFLVMFPEAPRHDTSGRTFEVFFESCKEVHDRRFGTFRSSLQLSNIIAKSLFLAREQHIFSVGLVTTKTKAKSCGL